MSDEERVVQGCPLRQYAAIYAAVGEGFPLEVVLDSAGIPAAGWSDVDGAWADALAEDAEGDGLLAAELDRALLELQAIYRRPVPPLDDDVGAWMRFARAWTSAPDPVLFLRELGLESSDALRLQRAWAARMDADPSLRARGAAAFAEGGPPPAIRRPAPLELRAPLRASARTGRLSGPPPAPATAPPSLLADLPTAKGDGAVPLRRIARTDSAATALRTVLGMPELMIDEEPELEPGQDSPFDSLRLPEGFELPAPESVARGAGEDGLSLVQYASLGAELEAAPARAEEIWAKYGLADEEARGRVDEVWQGRLREEASVYAEWRALHRHFLEHWGRVKGA